MPGRAEAMVTVKLANLTSYRIRIDLAYNVDIDKLQFLLN